ncbi:MAG: gliding motility-associated C-terminal domain-containing protein, partial [Bacteroidetes bacterium]|nr:gliding motility-associated C-terminal domain-containing protein [Bacteroidota bacterium]
MNSRNFTRVFLFSIQKIKSLKSAPLLAVLASLIALHTSAQYTKLFDFGGTSNGLNPYSSPITDGTFLYGMTSFGGANYLGTVYKVKTDGTGFTKLLDFDGDNGSNPYGSLFYDGTFLYGTTYRGGTNDHGTIFKLKPDGSGYTKLFDFLYDVSGGFPYASLISDGTYLYGTTSLGGVSNSFGTVFKIKTDGSGFSTLLVFNGVNNGGLPNGTLYYDGTFLYGTTSGYVTGGTIFKVKTDGSNASTIYQFTGANNHPYGGLVSDGTFLYGMTNGLGNSFTEYGTLFKIMPDGTNFSVIVNFNNTSPGATPKGALAFDGTYLYGTTTNYGANTRGTIFKVKTDGSGLTKILDNDVGTVGMYQPEGTLLLSGGVLYGTKSGGGSGVAPFFPGTLFKINTDGSNYTKLFFFDTEGYNPYGSVYSDGTFLYGMTGRGGVYDYGTIFKIKADGTSFQRLLDLDGANSGSSPYGALISDGTFLYGMTEQGGTNDGGIIFKVKNDGTNFSKLFDFDITNTGGSPHGSLFSDGTYLYGMTRYGGINSTGTIFKIKPDGTGFVKLLDFDETNKGSSPYGSFYSDGTYLYGTTYDGGSNGGGVIFKIKPDGSGFTKIFDLEYTSSGSYPAGDLVSDGTYLFTTMPSGGAHGSGTIIKIKPDGSGFAKLFDFNNYTGSNANGSLVLNGTHLYGMCRNGGANSQGTIFRIETDGTGFTKTLDLTDGRNPQGSLISDGTFLYGMATNGGANGSGVIFKTSLTPFVSISNIVPQDAVVGTYITLNGIGFDPVAANNVVKFNGTTAVVKSATDSTLVVIVPAGATTGPISISTSTTFTTASNFTVDSDAVMVNVTVQNCNVNLLPPTYDYLHDNNYIVTETFVPANPSDKVKISFSSITLHRDALFIYDGPTSASPLIFSSNNISSTTPLNIVSTGPGGELTFVYGWGDGTSDWDATITCVSASAAPVITPQPLTTQIGGTVTLNLVPLISTPGSSLDTTSLQITVPPSSGASASISPAGVLTIDYASINFSGTETLSIKACNANGQCATQEFSIEVIGDIIVYNGVSPNGANPIFVVQYIDILPDTKNNAVYIFDRWQNPVWHGSNYDNASVVFKGTSDSGGELPSGIYFYRIDFASGRKS